MKKIFLTLLIILVYLFSLSNKKLVAESYKKNYLEIFFTNDISINIKDVNQETIEYAFSNSGNNLLNFNDDNKNIYIKNHDSFSKNVLVVSSIDEKEKIKFNFNKYKYINLSMNMNGKIYISTIDFDNRRDKVLFDNSFNIYKKSHLIYLQVNNEINLEIDSQKNFLKFSLLTNLVENHIYTSDFFINIIKEYLLLSKDFKLVLNTENNLKDYFNIANYINNPFKYDLENGYISFSSDEKKYFLLIKKDFEIQDSQKIKIKKNNLKIPYEKADRIIDVIKKNIVLTNIKKQEIEIEILNFKKNLDINKVILKIKIRNSNKIFKFEIKVQLTDNIKPVISGKKFYIVTKNNITIKQIIEKLHAYDNIDKNISHNIRLKKKIFNEKENTYYLSFVVSDKANNISDEYIVKIKLIEDKYLVDKVDNNKIFLKENIKFNKELVLEFINHIENKNFSINKISKNENIIIILLKNEKEKIFVYEIIENIKNNQNKNTKISTKNTSNKLMKKIFIGINIYLSLSFINVLILIVLIKIKKKK